MKRISILAPLLAAVLLSAAPVLANDTAAAATTPAAAMAVMAGDIEISGAFSRATLPNAPVGAGYLTLVNKGTADDRLVAASSPVAGMVQLHEMKMDGDVMKMAELPDGIPVPAGQTVTLAPGGLHIMLMDLKQSLVEGSTFALTLTFEKAGTITIDVLVGAVGASEPAHGMSHSDTSGGSDHGGMAHHGSTGAVDQSGLSDLDAIAALQKSMFDKPDSPLSMGPVAVAGEYAVSDWAQDGMGGRALLRKTVHGWAIHLCAGAGLRDAAELARIGVPEAAAGELAMQLHHAEAALPVDQVALYDSFDGTMMVNEELI